MSFAAGFAVGFWSGATVAMLLLLLEIVAVGLVARKLGAHGG